MHFGALLDRLTSETDAAAALEALGDIVLFAHIRETGERFDEPPGEYVANATRRFAALAGDEDWLALMAAMERSDDPARAALERMLRWALQMDAAVDAPLRETGCACGSDRCHDQRG